MPHARGQHIFTRGDKRPSPVGTTVMVILRLFDLYVQHYVLNSSPFSRFFPSAHPVDGYDSIAATLPLYRLYAYLGLSVAPFAVFMFNATILSVFKHCLWATYLGGEYITVEGAIAVSVYNTIQNTLSNALFTTSGINPTWSFPCLPIGQVLVITGIVTEIAAEAQRKRFKNSQHNEGKVFMGGLFGVVRNPNYTGYTIWRTGMALMGGGWLWAIVAGFFFAWDFAARAIPEIESYGEERYGQQWEKFVEKVPYRLFPGIW
ncbi:MAG: hypothetical protein Q9227_004690 [Pyrenula ochraceoflavens]